MRPSLKALLALTAATAAAGTATLGYAAFVEPRRFTLRRVEVPVLPQGQRPLRVLHISDLHLTPGQQAKQDWVRALAGLEPDVVIGTGDFLAHPESVAPLLASLGPLLGRPGAFVFGSNDYYGPRPKNPAMYLSKRRTLIYGPELPWEELRDGLSEHGWLDLTNVRGTLEVDGRTLDLRGVDDPHLKADRYEEVAGPFDPAADLALGVVHAPYKRVLDAMAGDGAALVLAGHTHGGQLCIPGWGAIVTNCDLDPRRAKGLHRHPKPFLAGVPGLDDPSFGGVDGNGAWLHVSAGLGASPYAPVRFACLPEATLLTLVPRPV